MGWQNLDRTITYTQFHRVKGGGGVPPPSPTNNFDRVDEIQRFLRILLSVALGARFIKIHLITPSKVIGDLGGGGGGTPPPPFIL